MLEDTTNPSKHGPQHVLYMPSMQNTRATGGGPAIIAGDLNADPDDVLFVGT